MIDEKRPLAELPEDADLSKPEWSWGFADGETYGYIYHCEGERVIAYVLPKSLCQMVARIREHARASVESRVLRALGE